MVHIRKQSPFVSSLLGILGGRERERERENEKERERVRDRETEREKDSNNRTLPKIHDSYVKI